MLRLSGLHSKALVHLLIFLNTLYPPDNAGRGSTGFLALVFIPTSEVMLSPPPNFDDCWSVAGLASGIVKHTLGLPAQVESVVVRYCWASMAAPASSMRDRAWAALSSAARIARSLISL